VNTIFLVSKKNAWSDKLFSMLDNDFNCFYFNDDSYKENLSKKPDWIFFFHWSDIVSEKIHKNHKCVVIHTGRLPSDRGGSPIQNQILNGVSESMVNAITMEDSVDSGDIYISLPITLQGSLLDIWMSISKITYQLIKRCVLENPTPSPQIGTPSTYKRIRNNEINLDTKKGLCYTYDQIRMVDAEGYPNAYLIINGFKFEFTSANLNNNSIISDVRITKE